MAGIEEATGVQSARVVAEEARYLATVWVHVALRSAVATGCSGSRRSARPYCTRSRHASKARIGRASERIRT